jgi:hypothetical protein
MKRKIISLYILLLTAFGYATAQDIITVSANNFEISDNLDLQAVASIFGDSKNLEDFENRLNDPYTQISNLDLNRDGYVDYLRVVELSENHTHLIVIQAVIGNDLYQDVATIEVERDKYGVTTIQVVGDSYLYGPQYIIEPVYVYRPLIVLWFWGPHYRSWHSPYYWSYYPHYFKPWHPYHPKVYRTHVHVHINVHHTYHYTSVRKCGSAMNMYHQVARNDYGSRHPENSFSNRNRGITNRSGLNQHQSSMATNTTQQSRPARNVEPATYNHRDDRAAIYKQHTDKREKVTKDREKPARKINNSRWETSYDIGKRTAPKEKAANNKKPAMHTKPAYQTANNKKQQPSRYKGQHNINRKQSATNVGGTKLRSADQTRTSTVKKAKTSKAETKQAYYSNNNKSDKVKR